MARLDRGNLTLANITEDNIHERLVAHVIICARTCTCSGSADGCGRGGRSYRLAGGPACAPLRGCSCQAGMRRPRRHRLLRSAPPRSPHRRLPRVGLPCSAACPVTTAPRSMANVHPLFVQTTTRSLWQARPAAHRSWWMRSAPASTLLTRLPPPPPSPSISPPTVRTHLIARTSPYACPRRIGSTRI